MKLAAMLLVGCGAAASTPTMQLTTLFEGEGIQEARREAPDLVAQAEHAREDALRADAAGDQDAAEDYATRARLLLDAAVVEAERAQTSRARLAAQHDAEEATHAALQADEERATIETRASRTQAARIAEAQMQHAFEQAELDEARRLRRRGPEVDAARRQAASALRDRGRLLVAAARALGASGETATEIEALLASLDSDPAVALTAMRSAHRRALTLLGEARASQPVGEASRQSLLAAIRERGLEAELRDTGVALQANASRATVVAAIASAHPHGAIQIRGRGAAALRNALRRAGIANDRLQLHASTDELEILFDGYGSAAPR